MSRHEIPVSRLFESVADFADYCKSTDRAGHHSSSSQSNSRDWDLGLGYKGAIDMGQQGGLWSEGARKMSDTMAITSEMAALQPLPERARAVAGSTPCVPAYCLGHPMDMYKPDDSLRSGKPVLSIGVSMVSAWFVKAQDRLNQGAAVLTMIDQLESQGYRCELTSLYRTGPNNSRPFKQWANIEVFLKNAEEQWNPVTVAFALAHPAFLRRLGFKALETVSEWQSVCSDGYGDGSVNSKWENSMAEDFDIVIPNICGEEYSTPKKAFEVISKLVNRELKRLDEGAHVGA